MAEGAEVPIRVTADTGQAQSQLESLGSGFNRIETAGITAARRTLGSFSGMLYSINDVYNAQLRVNVANINYTLSVREYGAGSIQAARALDQLRVAQNGVEFAQERLNIRYLQFALSAGPAIYSTVTRLMKAFSELGIINYAEATSWYAKAAAIGLTVGLLTLGLGVAAGLAGSALVQQTIQQQNTFYGGGTADPRTMVDYTSQAMTSGLSSKVRS